MSNAIEPIEVCGPGKVILDKDAKISESEFWQELFGGPRINFTAREEIGACIVNDAAIERVEF